MSYINETYGYEVILLQYLLFSSFFQRMKDKFSQQVKLHKMHYLILNLKYSLVLEKYFDLLSSQYFYGIFDSLLKRYLKLLRDLKIEVPSLLLLLYWCPKE